MTRNFKQQCMMVKSLWKNVLGFIVLTVVDESYMEKVGSCVCTKIFLCKHFLHSTTLEFNMDHVETLNNTTHQGQSGSHSEKNISASVFSIERRRPKKKPADPVDYCRIRCNCFLLSFVSVTIIFVKGNVLLGKAKLKRRRSDARRQPAVTTRKSMKRKRSLATGMQQKYYE